MLTAWIKMMAVEIKKENTNSQNFKEMEVKKYIYIWR